MIFCTIVLCMLNTDTDRADKIKDFSRMSDCFMFRTPDPGARRPGSNYDNMKNEYSTGIS